MPRLVIQDQLAVKAPEVRPIEAGTTPHQALQSSFSKLPASEVQLYINGDLVFVYDDIMSKPLEEGDVLTVVCEVKKFVENIVSGLFDVVGDVVGFVLSPLTPDLPEFDTERKSPNNNFTSPTNIIRPFAQKAVVVGSPVIYPDLIGEAIEYYVGDVKQSEQYFYICFGELDGGTVQAGNTRLTGSTFGGAQFTQYKPVSGTATIPNYRIGKSVDEVDGQIIKGVNEGDEGTTYSLFSINDSSPPNSPATYVGDTFTYYVTNGAEAQALDAALSSAGGSLNVKVDYNTYSGTTPTSASGTGTLTSATLIPADPGVSPEEWEFVVSDFNGPKSPDDNYNGGSIIDPFDTTELLPAIIGPFVNPIEAEKMFFNIRFDRGLKNTVPLEVVVYQLDAKGGARTGLSETFNVTYTEDTLDEVLRTFEINIANGRDWYEFTIQRTNDASQDTTTPDIPKLEKVFCINELGDTDFDNATLMKVLMPATQVPTGRGVENKINIINGQVKMPSYDVNTGQILANAPSRKAADAILFLWKDFYKKDVSKLNLDELYAIQNKLDAINPEYAQFDYTYDDVETGLGNIIDIALNVMRANKYNDGNQIRFWRDEKESLPSNLLSRVDMVAESEREYSISKNMFVTGSKDSVQVEYINRDINKKAYIYRSISGGSIVNTPGQNPRKITLTGCQSLLNAENRADLEIRKLLYQRWTLTDTFIDTHKLLQRGSVVLYNEVYEGGESFGGQVLDINGNVITGSDKVTLDSGKVYLVYFTDLLGQVSGPHIASQINNEGEFEFTASNVNSVYKKGFDNSDIGSRYFITEVNDTINRQWRVIDKSSSGYNVQISMVNYDERVYENDPS